MALKLINAYDAKVGVTITIENAPCIVKSQDISKTGKHGHSKARIEAVGILDGKKRVIVVPGDERFEVPMIQKCKGQILSMRENRANIMDLETFETLDVTIDPDIRNDIKDGDNVEYWDIDGVKIVKRKS